MARWSSRNFAKVAAAALGIALPIVIFTSIGSSRPESHVSQTAGAKPSTVTASTFAPAVPGTPVTPVTGPPLVQVPVVNIPYPNPYNPGYTTIAQLVDDSEVVVVGSLGTPAWQVTALGEDGSQTTYYRIFPHQFLTPDPRLPLYVSQNLVNAAKLTATGTYVFFWAGPDDGGGSCITGGTRGVMAYDQSADTVARLDNDPNSRIPRTQTLEQFKNSIQAELHKLAQQPFARGNPPPACTLSATGLSQ